MDEQRFDAIARRFAMRSSRRHTIKAGALAAAAGLATALSGSVAAACNRVGDECDRDRDCCDAEICQGGRCRCRAGLTECDGRCRDLQRDQDDCGRCDNRCRGDEICDSGRCQDPKVVARNRCVVKCLQDAAQRGVANQTYANRCFFVECRQS